MRKYIQYRKIGSSNEIDNLIVDQTTPLLRYIISERDTRSAGLRVSRRCLNGIITILYSEK